MSIFNGKPDLILRRADRMVYQYRWHIIPRNNWFNLYLHKFLNDDDDRWLHDHPYDNISIPLSRCGYIEHLSDEPPEKVHRQRFRPIYRKAEDKHYIKLIPDWFVNEKNARLPCWSLFITFRRRREWGFYTADGWKLHNELLASPYTGYGDSKQLKHRP
jgi:hypothetical protein